MQNCLVLVSECFEIVRQGSAGRKLTAHPDPLAGFMGKTGKEEGRGRAGNGKKIREREKGNGKMECKTEKAGIEGEEMRQREMEEGKGKGRKKGRLFPYSCLKVGAYDYENR